MAIANLNVVTAGGATRLYVPLTQPINAYGVAVWRHDDVNVPPLYRAKVEQSTKLNAAGTNANCTMKIRIPVYDPITNSAKDTVTVSCSVTSLQTINGTQVKEAIQAMIAALTARIDVMSSGRTD